MSNFLPTTAETRRMYQPLIDEVGRRFPLNHSDNATEEARSQPGLFTLRNVLLVVASLHVGRANMYRGEIHQRRVNGTSTSHYYDPNRLQRMVDSREYAAQEMGEMACAACPLAPECGLGPKELVAALGDHDVRRRFRNRVRKIPGDNTHFCATNLSQVPLKKSEP